MKDQLDHLQELARRENIVIQVIPMKAPVCAQYTGPFVLASHNGESEVGYMD